MKKFIITYVLNNESKQRIIKAKNLYEARIWALEKYSKLVDIQEYFEQTKHKIKDEDLVFILKDLSVVLKSGMSLQEAILEFINYAYDEKVVNKFSVVYNKLINGYSYEESFIGILNSRELAVLKICEGKQELSKAFDIIVDLKEKNIKNLKQFKKAITYPILVFTCVILAFFVLIIFVLPEFQLLFKQLELPLPVVTKILFTIADFFTNFLIYIILGVFILIFFVIFFKNTFLFHKIMFYFPIFGKIIQNQDKFCFFIILSHLLSAGIDAKKAFELSIGGIENLFLKNKMFEAMKLFESGLDIAQAFLKIDIFEPFVIRMLKLALKSSKLDKSTYELALFFEYKKENYTQKLLTLLEPLMTIIMASLILILALGVFLPMWQMSQGVSF
ncbi:transformation system, type II secretion system membrane protein CtsF [Campylobacter sp. RM16704]|uniref:transformation system, type II secretion system membrane protein CtsF n=1 Tax=Campylobacter sp. RM16704 TaxID=1500960 RepID=UPI00057D81E3|nr:transformation system, type II secretion system membrane protein CtsF [Campylobacter sp. RM16704]AJC85911.1 transformation system, type II secretion system membrane protein CtsF [Campylobacter sp. RM16704]